MDACMHEKDDEIGEKEGRKEGAEDGRNGVAAGEINSPYSTPSIS